MLNEEQTQFLKELVGPVSRFFEVRNDNSWGTEGVVFHGVGKMLSSKGAWLRDPVPSPGGE